MASRAYTPSPPATSAIRKGRCGRKLIRLGGHMSSWPLPGPERVEFYVLDPTKRTYRFASACKRWPARAHA
jgi:hypothetical protein